MQLVDSSTSYCIITSRYGIGKSTDIDMGMKKASVKAMKLGEYKELGETLYIWFRQQRELHHPALQEKARLLFTAVF